MFGSVHSLRLELCAHFSLSHACYILRRSSSFWLLSPFTHHLSSGYLFFLQNPFFSNYLISGPYTVWKTMFQANTKQCVNLQFCPFLYLCCQTDHLLGSRDRRLDCHLGPIRKSFFCLWHGMACPQCSELQPQPKYSTECL